MVLLILAFLGGILTIISPCILPVLPFVFAKADQPFRKSGLPLAGRHGAHFRGIRRGGHGRRRDGWCAPINTAALVALVVLAIFGLTLLWPALGGPAFASLRPVGQPSGAAPANSGSNPSVLRSLLLGVATGLLWAPCAGPILGLILTGAALEGASRTQCFSAAGLRRWRRNFAGRGVVRGRAGVRSAQALLGSGGLDPQHPGRRRFWRAWRSIALGLDRGRADADFARQHIGAGTIADRPFPSQLARMPSRRIRAARMMMMSSTAPGAAAGPQTLPDLSGAVAWLNSPPLTPRTAQGHVVLVDFWTYSCINCLRTLPYIRAWAEKYKDSGLVVIGVHTPEFAFEKDLDNVRRAVSELKITYPVALDNDYKIWKAFSNSFWPADYLDRCHRPHSLSPLRRGQVRRNGAADPGTAQGTQRAVVRQRTGKGGGHRRGGAARQRCSNRPKPISVMSAPIASSRPADSSRTLAHALLRPRSIWNSINGDSPALGRITRRWRLSIPRRARSSTVSTRAICIWCWVLHRTESRSASG